MELHGGFHWRKVTCLIKSLRDQGLTGSILQGANAPTKARFKVQKTRRVESTRGGGGNIVGLILTSEGIKDAGSGPISRSKIPQHA